MTRVHFRCSTPKEVLVERLENKKKLASPTRYERVTSAFGRQRLGDYRTTKPAPS